MTHDDLTTSPDPDRLSRIEHALAEYMLLDDDSRAPDVAAFAARYPDLQPELGDLLAAEAALRRLAGPLRIEGRGPDIDGAGNPDPSPSTGTDFEPSLTRDDRRRGSDPDPTVPVAPRSDEPTEPGGDALPRGETVRYFGDYELLTELGRGGMGVVYRARQVSLNRPVALKMIKAGVLAADDDLRRFQNEAEAVALLDHPGIVPVHEVGEHQGQRYFSMRLVDGGNLAERLSAYRDDPRAAAALVAEAAEAVLHAHMRGILHRDLEPANILVDPEGHPHITDFGLAKRVEADADLTTSGAILGTPAYMAPEQASGRRGSITTATDVHGLGAVLYAMLTGRGPFGGDSIVDTLTMVREQPPVPPRKFNAKVPRDLEVICLKCLEKDPRRRYSGAQAVVDDLRRWLEDRPILARPVGALERARLWCRRKPAVAALAAAVVLAVVVGTAAVIAVQARANADLRASNAREKERFALAADAIRLFHGEVSRDLLLNEKQFEGLRGKLLRGAADFYGRLETLLEGQADRDSRASLGRAYFELGELTDEIGDKTAALGVHAKALAVRRALAVGPDTLATAWRDVARSLVEVGNLQASTGDADVAMASLREALAIRGRLAAADPSVVEFQEELAASHDAIGLLLARTGKPAGAMASHGEALTLWRKLAADHPATARFRRDLAACQNHIARVLHGIGKRAEALAMYREALASGRELARDNLDVAAFQGSWPRITSISGPCCGIWASRPSRSRRSRRLWRSGGS